MSLATTVHDLKTLVQSYHPAVERETIFRIHPQRRKQSVDQVDLGRVVWASEGFSGAEIEQAVIGALYRALHAGRAPRGHRAPQGDGQGQVRAGQVGNEHGRDTEGTGN